MIFKSTLFASVSQSALQETIKEGNKAGEGNNKSEGTDTHGVYICSLQSGAVMVYSPLSSPLSDLFLLITVHFAYKLDMFKKYVIHTPCVQEYPFPPSQKFSNLWNWLYNERNCKLILSLYALGFPRFNPATTADGSHVMELWALSGNGTVIQTHRHGQVIASGNGPEEGSATSLSVCMYTKMWTWLCCSQCCFFFFFLSRRSCFILMGILAASAMAA